jgi:hypothetical protein
MTYFRLEQGLIVIFSIARLFASALPAASPLCHLWDAIR